MKTLGFTTLANITCREQIIDFMQPANNVCDMILLLVPEKLSHLLGPINTSRDEILNPGAYVSFFFVNRTIEVIDSKHKDSSLSNNTWDLLQVYLKKKKNTWTNLLNVTETLF